MGNMRGCFLAVFQLSVFFCTLLPALKSGKENSMSNALVSIVDGIPTTTSQLVADTFGKRHDAVIRDIRKLQDNTPESFHAHNFVEMSQKVAFMI